MIFDLESWENPSFRVRQHLEKNHKEKVSLLLLLLYLLDLENLQNHPFSEKENWGSYGLRILYIIIWIKIFLRLTERERKGGKLRRPVLIIIGQDDIKKCVGLSQIILVSLWLFRRVQL